MSHEVKMSEPDHPLATEQDLERQKQKRQDFGIPSNSNNDGVYQVTSENDDLYDPAADDRDAFWVSQHIGDMQHSRWDPILSLGIEVPDLNVGAKSSFRKSSATSTSPLTSASASRTRIKHQEHPSGHSTDLKGFAMKTPASDAVLNCPNCFSVLTVSCQQNDHHDGQFRAMFVHNCRVRAGELLCFNGPSSGQSAKGLVEYVPPSSKRKQVIPDELFYPVHCGICDTRVGVYDKDEVYHFFDVFASFA